MLLEQNVLKIVVTGPESSGKTTLAQQLAEALGVFCVPEFARFYVANLGRPYQREDLKTIALGQQLWEDWFTQKVDQPSLLVCDTDWTVVYIWEQYKYGRSHLSPPLTILPSLYLLCAPDISWQPDPLREHPAERDALFDQYEDLLKYINADYHIMRGDAASRLATALHLVQKYY